MKNYIYPCPREKPTKKGKKLWNELKGNIPCERKEKSIKKRKKEYVCHPYHHICDDRTKEKGKRMDKKNLSHPNRYDLSFYLVLYFLGNEVKISY
jgi:hypothetical protein